MCCHSDLDQTPLSLSRHITHCTLQKILFYTQFKCPNLQGLEQLQQTMLLDFHNDSHQVGHRRVFKHQFLPLSHADICWHEWTRVPLFLGLVTCELALRTCQSIRIGAWHTTKFPGPHQKSPLHQLLPSWNFSQPAPPKKSRLPHSQFSKLPFNFCQCCQHDLHFLWCHISDLWWTFFCFLLALAQAFVDVHCKAAAVTRFDDPICPKLVQECKLHRAVEIWRLMQPWRSRTVQMLSISCRGLFDTPY